MTTVDEDVLILAEGRTLSIGRADITRLAVDAVVNAADTSLSVGGGVSGAIHAAGGPRIEVECARWVAAHGQLPTGQAMLTTGGDLPARHVIHTVGPIWRGGGSGEPALLASAYESSVALADAQRFETVAFPSVSTGIYGYPLELAAPLAIRALVRALSAAHHVRNVRIALFSDAAVAAYRPALGAERERLAGCGEDGEDGAPAPWW